MNIGNKKDLCAGLFFMAVGIAALWFGRNYSTGTAGKMGPGYFPMALGWLMTLLGGVIAAKAIRSAAESMPRIAFKPLLIITGVLLLFTLMITKIGLVVTTVAVVVASSAAGFDFRWRPVLLLAGVLAVVAAAIFHVGLSLPFPLWPELRG